MRSVHSVLCFLTCSCAQTTLPSWVGANQGTQATLWSLGGGGSNLLVPVLTAPNSARDGHRLGSPVKGSLPPSLPNPSASCDNILDIPEGLSRAYSPQALAAEGGFRSRLWKRLGEQAILAADVFAYHDGSCVILQSDAAVFKCGGTAQSPAKNVDRGAPRPDGLTQGIGVGPKVVGMFCARGVTVMGGCSLPSEKLLWSPILVSQGRKWRSGRARGPSRVVGAKDEGRVGAPPPPPCGESFPPASSGACVGLCTSHVHGMAPTGFLCHGNESRG